MKKILTIVGARPQFIKHAPMQLQLQKHFNALTIHTGQHYDNNMSNIFFNELNIPAPNYLFDIGGSKPQGEQTGIMITEIEMVCTNERPDAMLIYGDTNSTLAGALVAAKMQIPQIHVEAGLRSFNRSMPEEVNRIIADEFASLLFCPTNAAVNNLKKEGIENNIFTCGDVMCDILNLVRDKITRQVNGDYFFVTLHRPYNTDDSERILSILTILQSLNTKIIFPIHPRTLNRITGFGVATASFPNIEFVEPVGYIESLSYQKYAKAIITDSGGIQKEAYMLRKKCITLRSETEWVETLTNGWNSLVFDDLSQISELIDVSPGAYIEDIYGDGHASEKMVKIIKQHVG